MPSDDAALPTGKQAQRTPRQEGRTHRRSYRRKREEEGRRAIDCCERGRCSARGDAEQTKVAANGREWLTMLRYAIVVCRQAFWYPLRA